MYRSIVSICLLACLGCGVKVTSTKVTMPAPTAATTATSATAPIKILGWNIESGGSSTPKIVEQLKSQMPKADILALSEVPPADVDQFVSYFRGGDGLACDTNGSDRLTLAWTDRFQLIRHIKLNKEEIAPGGHRAPLIVHLREKATQRDFIVMNNHLARGNAELRTKQAQMLVDWARDQTLPIIAVGDYNMDYSFVSKSGNDAFAAMLSDGIYKWVQPKELIDTNWSDNDGDGKDNYPDSMLDFTFVAGPAMDWNVTSEVIVLPGDWPDDETTSDHRAVLTTVNE